MEAKDKTPALAVQIGGGHYKDMPIQPFEYIHANGIPFAEGCVIKYVSRWRNKAGIQDLKKARHFLDLLIEAEERKAEQAAAVSDGAQPVAFPEADRMDTLFGAHFGAGDGNSQITLCASRGDGK